MPRTLRHQMLAIPTLVELLCIAVQGMALRSNRSLDNTIDNCLGMAKRF